MKNKTILFLSPVDHLSIMAKGWASCLNEPSWNVVSASCMKADYEDLPVEAMKEVNIDIERSTSHSLKPQLFNEADVVIAIYDFQRDSLPAFPNESSYKILRWNIPNPLHFEKLMERWAAYQVVCDELAVKIKELKKELL